MSFLTKLFGPPAQRKSISFQYEGDTYSSVIAGYPTWPFWDTYGLMYRKQPAVRTVVDFIAQNIAQLNPKIYDRISDTDRRAWNDHPVSLLLHNPNPETTRYRFLFGTVADQCIYDRAYWRKVKQGGATAALVRIPPSRLQVEVDYDTLKTTYRFKGEAITRDQLVILPGYHPDGGDEGVSPLETLRRVLAEDWAAGLYREFMWRNGARQPMIIKRGENAPEWSKEARERFRTQLANDLRNGQGPPPLLEDGMELEAAAFSAADSQYIEGRKLTQEEVARVYAPSLVGLLTSGSKGSIESFHRQLYQDVLAPRLRMLQDEIDLQLLGLEEFDQGGEPYCEFNLADKLKGSFEEQADTLVRSVGVPYMSINEGRARLNLPRLVGPEYDEPIQPMNVLYGGQPSVVNPTADPGNPEPLAAVPQAASRNGFALLEFLDRQEQAVKSRLGANKEDWWQFNRWDRELSEIVGDAAPLMNVNVYEEIQRAGCTVDAVTEAFRHAKMEATKTEVAL